MCDSSCIYFLYFIPFLIGIKLEKCVTELFLKILLRFYTALINIKPKESMIKLLMILYQRIRDWFVTSKMIKELYTASYADERIM